MKKEERLWLTPLPYIPERSENVNRHGTLIFVSMFPVETKFWRFNT